MSPRPVTRIHVTSDFQKSFRKLPAVVQSLAEKRDLQFRADAFDRRLRTHKLKGALDGYWAYSVNYRYRVVFRFVEGGEVIYYDIGTHEIYR